jgi:hypothetical protein
MVRTIIGLEEGDKAWLGRKAAEQGVPMAELVRTAVRRMRDLDEASFQELLRKTRGIWKRGDGLAYQRRIRKEWR